MAITNYTELQTAIADWSKRSASQAVDFIALAETRINALLASRMAEVESSLTGVVGSRYIALPSGFIYPLALWRDYPTGTRSQIIYASAEVITPNSASNGFPGFYMIDGSNIAFEYPNSEAFTYILRYKKGYDIAATTTNDILTNYPDVYLYGALVEAAAFAREYNIIDRWEARFQEALKNAHIAESQNSANATLFFDSAITGNRTNIYDGGF